MLMMNLNFNDNNSPVLGHCMSPSPLKLRKLLKQRGKSRTAVDMDDIYQKVASSGSISQHLATLIYPNQTFVSLNEIH